MVRSTLNVGVARRDITPPLGYPRSQWGGQSLPATATLRPLLARVMAFSTQPTEPAVALVSLDLCLISDQITRTVERALRERIPGRQVHVVLNCSHSHEAPAIDSVSMWTSTTQYVSAVTAAVADAVVEAVENAQPATLGLAQRQTDGLNRNRRRKDQPIDRTLSVLRIDDAAGRPIALAWHFAAHPLTNMGATGVWDADFCGQCNQQVELDHPGLHCQYLQGVAGDVFPMDWYLGQASPTWPTADRTTRHMGGLLADHVRQLLPLAQPIDVTGGLNSRERTIDVPVRRVSWTVEQAQAAADRWAGHLDLSVYQPWLADDHVTMIAQKHEPRYACLCARFCVEMARRQGTTMPCRLAVARIGALALPVIPGELFSELGFAILAHEPALHTLILPYSNDNLLYLPTRRDLEEVADWPLDAFLNQKQNRWAYGATATTFVGPATGEMIVNTCCNLIDQSR